MSLISGALIDLTHLKEYLSITSSTKDDFLTEAVNRASDYLINATNRNWVSTEYTEVYDSKKPDRLFLNNMPIIEVSSLEKFVDDEWVDIVDIAGDTLADQIQIYGSYIRLREYSFPVGCKVIRITYTAGFAIIPYDIQEACTLKAAMYWYESKTGEARLGKESGTISGAGSPSNSFSFKDPKRIEEIILRHRRIPISL